MVSYGSGWGGWFVWVGGQREEVGRRMGRGGRGLQATEPEDAAEEPAFLGGDVQGFDDWEGHGEDEEVEGDVGDAFDNVEDGEVDGGALGAPVAVDGFVLVGRVLLAKVKEKVDRLLWCEAV